MLLGMKFSKESIEEFIQIWKAEFGEELSEDDARVRAGQLSTLYWLLMTGQRPEEAPFEDFPEKEY